jgi:hypothetical protein
MEEILQKRINEIEKTIRDELYDFKGPSHSFPDIRISIHPLNYEAIKKINQNSKKYLLEMKKHSSSDVAIQAETIKIIERPQVAYVNHRD